MLSLPDSYKGYITADIIYSAGINEQEIIIDMGFTIETGISAITVFVQGLLSFFSPCVLPLVPLYLGYLSGGLNSGLDGTEKEEAGASAAALCAPVMRNSMRAPSARLPKTFSIKGLAAVMSGVTTSTSSGRSVGSASNCACSQSASASSSRVAVGAATK